MGGMAKSNNFSQKMMSMNQDTLKGKWLEIKGRAKERWGKLTDNKELYLQYFTWKRYIVSIC
jgi:hypothetical protein